MPSLRTDRAPIVLIHGSTIDSHTDWDSVAPWLARHDQVFTPDCRGLGKSNNPNRSYSFRELAVEHPEVTQKCVLQAANACVTRYLIGPNRKGLTRNV